MNNKFILINKEKQLLVYLEKYILSNIPKNEITIKIKLNDEIYKLIEKEINKIDLTLNNKSNIYKLSNGIVFLGYKFKLNKNKLEIRYNNKTIRRIEKN